MVAVQLVPQGTGAGDQLALRAEASGQRRFQHVGLQAVLRLRHRPLLGDLQPANHRGGAERQLVQLVEGFGRRYRGQEARHRAPQDDGHHQAHEAARTERQAGGGHGEGAQRLAPGPGQLARAALQLPQHRLQRGLACPVHTGRAWRGGGLHGTVLVLDHHELVHGVGQNLDDGGQPLVFERDTGQPLVRLVGPLPKLRATVDDQRDDRAFQLGGARTEGRDQHRQRGGVGGVGERRWGILHEQQSGGLGLDEEVDQAPRASPASAAGSEAKTTSSPCSSEPAARGRVPATRAQLTERSSPVAPAATRVSGGSTMRSTSATVSRRTEQASRRSDCAHYTSLVGGRATIPFR